MVSKEAIDALQEYTNDARMLDKIIHSRVAFKNSISYGKGVSEYENKGKAAYEVKKLFEEIAPLMLGEQHES